MTSISASVVPHFGYKWWKGEKKKKERRIMERRKHTLRENLEYTQNLTAGRLNDWEEEQNKTTNTAREKKNRRKRQTDRSLGF